MPLRSGPSTRRKFFPAAIATAALAFATVGGAAPAQAAVMHDMAAMPGMAMGGASTPTPAATPAASATKPQTGKAAASSMFQVGSKAHPLYDNGPVGPLSAMSPASIPGRAFHGTFAQIWVAAQLAKRSAATRPPATAARAATTSSSPVLTTAQATKKLTKTCQRLVKAKPGKLSTANRKKRTKCLDQRKKLVAASKKAAAPSTSTTGASAPAAPIQGPAPVVTATPTPSGTTPKPTPTPTPTPAPGSTGVDPSTVVCSAVGVTSYEIAPFALTRGVACNDDSGVVNVEFTNTDATYHGIEIKAAGAPDSSGVVIVGTRDPHSAAKSVNVSLAPGDYILLCTISEHNLKTSAHASMEVPFKVLTKADYIAQGYAG